MCGPSGHTLILVARNRTKTTRLPKMREVGGNVEAIVVVVVVVVVVLLTESRALTSADLVTR